MDMNNSNPDSSSFTTTHFMIYFVTTLLLLMALIYWTSGCQMKDHSMNAGKQKTETSASHGEHH